MRRDTTTALLMLLTSLIERRPTVKLCANALWCRRSGGRGGSSPDLTQELWVAISAHQCWRSGTHARTCHFPGGVCRETLSPSLSLILALD